MLDVLFLTMNDNANTGWRFFKCAQMAGMQVMGFKANAHPYCYPEQLLLHPDLMAIADNENLFIPLPEGNDLNKFARAAKVIHFIASTCIWTGVDLEQKPVVMQHGGRGYRTLHEQLNPKYNIFCDATIIQMPDLLGFGAKNEHFIYFPVDTDFIRPSFEKVNPSDKLVIGFFPSQPSEKGMKDVTRVIDNLPNRLKDKFEFRLSTNDLVWLAALDQLKECDLIIDVFSAKTIDGLDYGEWGNTAFEAAAMGKIVLTMSTHFDRYLAEFGDCALNITNTEDELSETLCRFIEMPSSELKQEKRATRAWVESKHSMQATSKRLMNVYKEIM